MTIRFQRPDPQYIRPRRPTEPYSVTAQSAARRLAESAAESVRVGVRR